MLTTVIVYGIEWQCRRLTWESATSLLDAASPLTTNSARSTWSITPSLQASLHNQHLCMWGGGGRGRKGGGARGGGGGALVRGVSRRLLHVLPWSKLSTGVYTWVLCNLIAMLLLVVQRCMPTCSETAMACSLLLRASTTQQSLHIIGMCEVSNQGCLVCLRPCSRLAP